MPASRTPRAAPETAAAPDWTFFSNHFHVLGCLVRWPQATQREIAGKVGITERAVQRIVADLESDGYLTRERVGRENRYRLNLGRKLRHPLEQHCRLSALFDVLLAGLKGE